MSYANAPFHISKSDRGLYDCTVAERLYKKMSDVYNGLFGVALQKTSKNSVDA
ncbi:hypothetical protein [Nostoc sp. ChiSLP03a]|uniref:hypothetical protein n=1 Tax=Nostoc sp. ChiSLP03a TaxID=3075380 RepID=UPI002AD33237|nr:hypothetical protein [Nostoc sp. ChiSLP03a]MDZ8213761.1 hypothetical protein [Nostoc sp. ChiSLP03a]